MTGLGNLLANVSFVDTRFREEVGGRPRLRYQDRPVGTVERLNGREPKGDPKRVTFPLSDSRGGAGGQLGLVGACTGRGVRQ